MFALSQLSTLVMPADDSGGEIDEGLWASLQSVPAIFVKIFMALGHQAANSNLVG
jgi:hypothetical protein